MGQEDTTAVEEAASAATEREERERALFSKADRKYLFGEQEYEYDQSEVNTRFRIRNRIINGLLDLQLLDRISEKDREMVFEDVTPSDVSLAAEEFLEFTYRALDYDTEAVERFVSRAIYNAQLDVEETDHTGPVSEVSTEIEIERPPNIEEVYQRYREHGWARLTNEELGLLVRTGKLDLEDVETTDGLPPRTTLSPDDE